MRLGHARPALVAFVVAVLALILGAIGYAAAPGLDLSATDALFGSLQLFAMEGGTIEGGTPWQLDIARFLAPLTVVYAAVMTAAALLRNEVQRFQVGLFAKSHTVVIGLGARGTAVAKSMATYGWDVVGAEIDARSPGIAVARANGARVLVGDGQASAELKACRASRARHIVAATGDDSKNLAVAAGVRELVGERKAAAPVHVHVSIKDTALWKELHQLQLRESAAGSVVEYLNWSDRAASQLVAEAEKRLGASHLPWVMVEGDPPLSTRVIVHLVRHALIAGGTPHIELLPSRTAGEILAMIKEDEPWIESHAELRLIPEYETSDNPAPVALVCWQDAGSHGLSRGLRLARQIPRSDVFVTSSSGAHWALPRVADTLRLHLVQTDERLVGDLLEHSSAEVMAKVRHEHYVAAEQAAGRTAVDNPSLVQWNELPESLKESNRRFAESVVATVAQLGGSIVPLNGPPTETVFRFDDATLDHLAQREHDRWSESLRADGWTYSPGPKDPEAKQHPLLVPWDRLDEAERQKDRDAFLAVPVMLARAGYAVNILPAGPDRTT